MLCNRAAGEKQLPFLREEGKRSICCVLLLVVSLVYVMVLHYKKGQKYFLYTGKHGCLTTKEKEVSGACTVSKTTFLVVMSDSLKTI